MKTVEEKAIAFVRELQEKLINSNHSGFYIINEILGVAHKSFMIGYSEAMRWRDSKVELPEVGIKVLVKTSNGKYIVSEMYTPKDCNGLVLGGSEWRGSYDFRMSVIGWRPIE